MATMAIYTAGSLLVGGLVASSYSTNIEDTVEPRPEIGDARIQTSGNAIPITILYGQQSIAGNIIWIGELTEVENVDEQEVGGKGGGGDTVTHTWYTYYGSIAIALCEGPLESGCIKKIWANDELILDNEDGSADFSTIGATIYYGTETQLPDPVIEAESEIDSVPAFRGLVYLVLENFDIGLYSNQWPNFQVEIEGK